MFRAFMMIYAVFGSSKWTPKQTKYNKLYYRMRVQLQELNHYNVLNVCVFLKQANYILKQATKPTNYILFYWSKLYEL